MATDQIRLNPESTHPVYAPPDRPLFGFAGKSLPHVCNSTPPPILFINHC